MKIPLNRPVTLGNEWKYLRNSVNRGHLSGDGFYTRLCSALLEKQLQLPRVLLTSSCTHALELAFLLLDIKPGDEVILPSFTFPSTANAFVLRGAIPKFVDIRPDTLNIDEGKIASALSPRVKAIVPVHYAGVSCEMDTIVGLGRSRKIPVIEDAAQALGGSFRNRLAGTWGDMGAFSFHETKNCICGEGGALAMRKSKWIKRAEIIRQKGTNREQYYRGQVDKYSWVDIGSSYVPSELQAAYLYAQLEKINVIFENRRKIFNRYQEAFEKQQSKGRFQIPYIPSHVQSSYHLYHLIFDGEKERNRIIRLLNQRGILSVFHYFPLHCSKMGRRFGYRKGDFPETEKVSSGLLRLPIFNSMKWAEQRYIISVLRKII